MSEPTRPWWASDPVDGDVDRSVDPVEAHRAARRGWLDPDAASSGPDAASSGPDGAASGTDGACSDGAGHAEQICGVCPVCVLARAVGESRPELLGHLAEAARHLSAAARSFLEPHAPAGPPDEGSAGDPAAATEDRRTGTPSEDGTSGPRRRQAASGRPPQRIDLDP